MSGEGRAGRWGGLAAEVLGSLLLVFVLYGLFMLFLYAIFPLGTPLRDLMGSGGEREPERQAAHQPDATLSTLVRDVRCRRSNSIAWGGATEGMQLYSEDAVQTLDRSGASIAFDKKDRLQVGSNSLIVVTRLNQEDQAGPRSYRVSVDGDVHGTLSASRKLDVQFEAAGHVASFAPGAAKFRLARSGSSSSSLAVYAGEARIAGKRGTVRVPARYGVALYKDGKLGAVVPLPAAPLLGENREGTLRYRLLPPKVRFTWSGAPGVYHFQLSREQHFTSCEIDRRVDSPELVAGKLSKGSYFWRVSRLDHGVEGRFSQVGRCTLVQQLDAPGLKVDFPADSGETGPCTLTGSAPAGSRIFVDGGEVAPGDDGSFAAELRLKPGVNLIRVEATDATGNASYASRIVYRGRGNRGRAAVQGTQGTRPVRNTINQGGPEWKRD